MFAILSVITGIGKFVGDIFNKYQDRKIQEVKSGVVTEKTQHRIIATEVDNNGKSWRSDVLRSWSKLILCAVLWNQGVVKAVAWLWWYVPFILPNADCLATVRPLPTFDIPNIIVVSVIGALFGYIGLEKTFLALGKITKTFKR